MYSREQINDMSVSCIETRQDFLANIIGQIQVDPSFATDALFSAIYWANEKVLSSTDENDSNSRMYKHYKASNGSFTANGSLNLLAGTPIRLKRFSRAIAEAEFPNGSPIVDIGTGATAILALIAAVSHPESLITAYEIDPESSKVAHNTVELFGFSERIEVVNANYLSQDPMPAGLVVSETFMSGLTHETGPSLLKHASIAGVDVMIPDSAILFARIDPNSDWQDSGVVQFREFDGRIKGRVAADTGLLRVRCDYYTDNGRKLVIGGVGSDLICGSSPIENVYSDKVQRAYSYIEFSYPSGFDPSSVNPDGFTMRFVSKLRPQRQ